MNFNRLSFKMCNREYSKDLLNIPDLTSYFPAIYFVIYVFYCKRRLARIQFMRSYSLNIFNSSCT